jgi:hypothetical protein
MARLWCDTHPLVYHFVPQKERALSRKAETREYPWVRTTRLLTSLTYLRDGDDAKKRHCSAVHPALNLHHPRVLHKPCKGRISWMLIQRLKHRMKFQKRRVWVPTHFAEPAHLSYSGYNIHVHTLIECALHSISKTIL